MESSYLHNRMTDTAYQMAESSRQFVGEHVPSSTLTAFGIGLATGVALVYLFADSQRYQPSLSERLGRQVLDALGKAAPDLMSRLER